jgi:hypothetical protein
MASQLRVVPWRRLGGEMSRLQAPASPSHRRSSSGTVIAMSYN